MRRLYKGNTRSARLTDLPAVELRRLNRETEAIFLLGNFRIGKSVLAGWALYKISKQDPLRKLQPPL